MDVTIGSACHKGLEQLLGLRMDGAWTELTTPAPVADSAVRAALDLIDREERTLMRSNGQEFEHRADIKALVELIVRVFAQHFMPTLLLDYKILSVESERPIILADDIVMEIKADATLEDIHDGAKLAWSLKTCGEYADWLAQRDRLALQNYTEPYAYKCDGVQMCYLIKGTKGERFPFQGNSVLYPWHKDGQYSWTYYYTNEDGQTKALGPTWQRVAIHERMSIPEWLAHISHVGGPDAYMPYHRQLPWSKIVRIPPATRRHPEEIRVVMDSLRRAERDHFARLAQVDETDPASLELNFPREFTDCAGIKGSCPYYQCCVTNLLPKQMVDLGFSPRQPHHAFEAAAHASRKER